MPRYDASTAEVLVFTFKEGLLAAMAHDLKLRLERFQIDREGDALQATFSTDSLKVVSPRKDGRDEPGLLPALVYGEIEKNAREDALQARKHPQAAFVSSRVTDAEVVVRIPRGA